ncbi:MAG TPA: hypothetical protein VLR94_03520 [Acidobacteriota bacterium]|nr:hypothetical protein [Acidobacteriota bacterium]
MSPRFQVGDRIKIRRSWSEEDGAVGTVAEPPDPVRNHSGYGSSYYRLETSLTGATAVIYWIAFDAPNVEQGGEFDETELETL